MRIVHRAPSFPWTATTAIGRRNDCPSTCRAAIGRRTLLKSLSAGASGLFLPLINKLSAQDAGVYRTPKRVVFVLFGNGFHEPASLPKELPAPQLEGTRTRVFPLADLTLPHDIEPFTPWKDRLAIIHGLRSGSVHPDHGAGFGALAAVNVGVGDDKRRNVLAESIDAAIARKLRGIYPLLNLGIDPGQPATKAVRCSSAWGPGRPLAAQCRPELAYESLFGAVNATRNDFALRRNLLDLLRDDIKALRSQLRGAELTQLDYQIEAYESMSRRNAELSGMFERGELAKSAPKLPAPFPTTFTDTVTAQFDIAASALVAGLTHVATIATELCTIRGNYTGISDMGTHGVGHNEKDAKLGLTGLQILPLVRRHIAERTAALLKRLADMPEDGGTMLDNTLVVFTSDSANRQHTHGENWPFVLLGNLGGRIKTGQLVVYPISKDSPTYSGTPNRYMTAAADNPSINALYNTLLHAVGDPREHFNLAGQDQKNPTLAGPLRELLE
jgi:hypothetical protein